MENNNTVKIYRLFGGEGVKEGCSEQLKFKCRLKDEKAPASKGWRKEDSIQAAGKVSANAWDEEFGR